MKNGRMVGTVAKSDVNNDEVLGMIIAGTPPRTAKVTNAYLDTRRDAARAAAAPLPA